MSRRSAAEVAEAHLARARRGGDAGTIARAERGSERARREQAHYDAAQAADMENVEAMRQLAEIHRNQQADDLERTHGNRS
jgi:hypothetical protein